MKISPSILAADLSKMHEILPALDSDYIHLDVMDGIFVPNLTFGMQYIHDIRKYTDIPFDTHLMIQSPDKYIEEFALAGSDLITFHFEAVNEPSSTIQKIKKTGKKCGISIKPKTKISVLEDLIEDLDLVLLMSVEPGFSGQKFIPYSIDKLLELKALRDKKAREVLISIDGGIDFTNIDQIKKNVDIVVAGSMIFNGDFADNISRFHAITI